MAKLAKQPSRESFLYSGILFHQSVCLQEKDPSDIFFHYFGRSFHKLCQSTDLDFHLGLNQVSIYSLYFLKEAFNLKMGS